MNARDEFSSADDLLEVEENLNMPRLPLGCKLQQQNNETLGDSGHPEGLEFSSPTNST